MEGKMGVSAKNCGSRNFWYAGGSHGRLEAYPT